MKKIKCIALLGMILPFLSLSSCVIETEDGETVSMWDYIFGSENTGGFLGENSSGSSQTASGSETWSYTTSNAILKVDSSTKSVTINGNIGGKSIYLAKVNPSTKTIAAQNQRTIKSSSKSLRSVVTVDNAETPDFEPDLSNSYKHFVGETLPSAKGFVNESYSSRAVSTSGEKTWNIGDTNSIYIDTDSSMSDYTKKTATLRAIGSNCYVWVVDAYYTSDTASGKKVNTSIAETFATKFDSMYPLITNVFGNESDKIIDYSSQKLVDMSSISDTGKKINIVIYDIGNDYQSSETISTTGIVGYFYSKDYYYTNSSVSSSWFGNSSSSVINKSNVGKYFYIDSAYAVSNFNDTISTLAHEFQHMVNFGMKNMNDSINDEVDTAYNEMLSMLCEDMMQNYLGLEDSESPKNRFKYFNEYYYYSGIREYRDDEYAVLSYSTSYAFGAWLCRQYGGAALVNKIMSNNYVGSESLVNAVNSLNSTQYSFDDLFQQFLLSLFNDSTYTMNKNAKQTISYNNSYKYPMTAINIYSDEYETSELKQKLGSYAYSHYSYKGPVLLSTQGACDLRPNYGITLHGAGIVPSGTSNLTLTFSDSGSSNLVMYLIIK